MFKISKLPNGIRIASQASSGHFISAGIYIETGSRFETLSSRGSSHLLDRMAFKSTTEITADRLVNTLENLGGNIMSQANRELIMYQASVFRKDLPNLIKTFSQMVLHPLLDPEEILQAQKSTLYEIQNRQFNSDETLPELLHATAFSNTLGQPLYNDMKSLSLLNSEILRDFHSTWFTPNRIVVAGVGMEHQELVDLVSMHFGDAPAPSLEIKNTQSRLSEPVKYTGGISIIDTKNYPTHPNPEHFPLTHLQIVFEAPSQTDPDYYALATYAQLMGGGGSFSAGGPGKGMYTRLYTSVLNRYGWIESCHFVNHSYSDSTLFGITAAVPPSKDAHHHFLEVVCDQLLCMTEFITIEELSRAKNQLKSSLLMALESQMSEAEDIGRQMTAYDKRVNVVDVCKRIDSLNLEDMKRIARRVILGSKEISPLDHGDTQKQHWKRTGDGSPTVLISGPLVKNDPVYKIDEILKRWGIKVPKYNSQPQQLSVEKRWNFGKINK